MDSHIRRLARNLGICAIACGLLSACGERSAPASPTPAPAPPVPSPPPIPQGTFTVSGVVSEVVSDKLIPLEGVHVEDSTRHYFINTGSDGSYAIRDVAAGAAYFYIAKEGYRREIRQFTLTSDTRLDIQLLRE